MIVTKNDPSLPYLRGGETCFHCGKAVWSDTAIHWHGSDDRDETINILFHAGCALDFIVRLANDVHEVETRSRLEVRLVGQPGAKRAGA